MLFEQVIADAIATIARFTMAESIARQTNCSPLQVMGAMRKFMDESTQINEGNMAEVVDKTVEYIRNGEQEQ